jgi:hypothetical protein
MLGVAFVHPIERGHVVHGGAPPDFRDIAVRRLRDRHAGLGHRLAAVGRRGEHLLVLERYGDRREVGLGPADPLGKGLEAIAVPVGSTDSSA